MVNWNVAGSVDASFCSPLQPVRTAATAAATSSRIRTFLIKGGSSVSVGRRTYHTECASKASLASEAEILRERNANHFLEPLRKRLDRSRRLVEKDPLHAEQRHEHGDQIEIVLVLARELPDPVIERIEVDGAQRQPGRRERGQY